MLNNKSSNIKMLYAHFAKSDLINRLIHGCKASHNEKRKSFNFSTLLRLSYKHPCPSGHNEYRVVDAEPNSCMPPPGRGNGSDPELLDSPMGLFHYPSPGALLRLLGHFIFI